jgi:hypothetical protein
MSDKQLERLEKLMGDLIQMVGATNARTAKLEEQIAKIEAQAAQRHEEVMARLDDMALSMARLERMEFRVKRTTERIDELETDVAMIQNKLQS